MLSGGADEGPSPTWDGFDMGYEHLVNVARVWLDGSTAARVVEGRAVGNERLLVRRATGLGRAVEVAVGT